VEQEQERKLVSDMIRSGAYYDEALKWFHALYTKPRTDLSLMTIIGAVAIFAFLVGFAAFVSFFPIVDQRGIIISRELVPNDYITINEIKKKGDTTDSAFIKFLLEEYTVSREEYILQDPLNSRKDIAQKDYTFVVTHSSNEVIEQYIDENSPSNPQNPRLKYGNNAQRLIYVNSVKLFDAAGKPTNTKNAVKAVVVFADSSPPSYFQADISFQYKGIVVDQKTGKVPDDGIPDILITSYQTKSM